MRKVQTAARFEPNPNRLRRRQPGARIEHGAQRSAGEVFHDQERNLGLSPVVHSEDVGVVEPCSRLGFGSEPIEECRVGSEALVEHLDGDRPLQTEIVGEPYRCGCALPDRTNQSVPLGELCARRCRKRLQGRRRGGGTGGHLFTVRAVLAPAVPPRQEIDMQELGKYAGSNAADVRLERTIGEWSEISV